jgi:hypothetical protein
LSPVVPLLRQVPTLTEVLEEAVLSSLSEARVGQGQGLDVELDIVADGAGDGVRDSSLQAAADLVDPAEGLRQAVLSLVDAAIEEFRAELLSRLEPLFERGALPRSE